MFKIVEKRNHNAIHCICDSLESAELWINEKAVEYCQKGYFMDKTLTPNDFEIVQNKNKLSTYTLSV